MLEGRGKHMLTGAWLLKVASHHRTESTQDPCVYLVMWTFTLRNIFVIDLVAPVTLVCFGATKLSGAGCCDGIQAEIAASRAHP